MGQVAIRSNVWRFVNDVTAKKNYLGVGKNSMKLAFGSE
jgi:hypothetical protein